MQCGDDWINANSTPSSPAEFSPLDNYLTKSTNDT